MADIESIRAEIDRARKFIDRQRRDILTLQRTGHATADAELILVQQLVHLDDLIGERNMLRTALPGPTHSVCSRLD